MDEYYFNVKDEKGRAYAGILCHVFADGIWFRKVSGITMDEYDRRVPDHIKQIAQDLDQVGWKIGEDREYMRERR